jgi:ABC-2 type transport system permease protein
MSQAALLEPSASRRAWRVFAGTSWRNVLEFASRPILIVRALLTPILYLLTYLLAYRISGQRTVDGQDSLGFLFMGMVAVDAWNSTLWGSGYAFQHERDLQTIGAVMMAPINRTAYVLGNGMALYLWTIPAHLAGLVVALGLGARFDVRHPVALVIALLALYLGSLAVGYAFAPLFILSRQANMIANFLQVPIYLIAGFLVPRSVLPGWLASATEILPIVPGLDASRDTALSGAGFAAIWPSLALWAAGCVLFFAIGLWGLGRVDRIVRQQGTLELTG